jgi:HAD superfamily hydrolase (TIGR01484 family)
MCSALSPFLFVTDIDNTLVPAEHLEERPETPDIKALKSYLTESFHQSGSIMVLATGRHPDKCRADTLLNGFPARYAICNVGTEIWELTDGPCGEWALMDAYQKNLSGTGFDHTEIYRLCREIAKAHPTIKLRPQEDWRNTDLKASHYADLSVPLEQLEAILKQGLGDHPASIILSTQDQGKVFVDILPENAGKGYAMCYLANYLQQSGITLKAAIAAGDSGNDIDLFNAEKFKVKTGLTLLGIVPSNGKDELTRHTKALEAQGHKIHHARTPMAAGVLEGLRHFNL